MSSKKKFEPIRCSVNGKRTKFKIGDVVQFCEDDTRRVITKIMVDSDCCVQYCVSYLRNGHVEESWMSENDFNVMETLTRKTKFIGFM